MLELLCCTALCATMRHPLLRTGATHHSPCNLQSPTLHKVCMVASWWHGGLTNQHGVLCHAVLVELLRVAPPPTHTHTQPPLNPPSTPQSQPLQVTQLWCAVVCYAVPYYRIPAATTSQDWCYPAPPPPPAPCLPPTPQPQALQVTPMCRAVLCRVTESRLLQLLWTGPTRMPSLPSSTEAILQRRVSSGCAIPHEKEQYSMSPHLTWFGAHSSIYEGVLTYA